MTRIRVAIVSLATFLFFADFGDVFAGDAWCAKCGCKGGGSETVCRLVKTEKTIEVTCWACKCEEFCVPGKSHRECRNCEIVCDNCGDLGGKHCHSGGLDPKPKKVVWYSWIPGCAKVHTRKKLYRKVEKVTVPSYKWVVESLCDKCESKTEAATIEPGVDVPVPPAIQAKLIYGQPTSDR